MTIPFQSDNACDWARELLSDEDVTPHMYVGRILKSRNRLCDEQRYKSQHSHLPELSYVMATGEIDPHYAYQRMVMDFLPLANVLHERLTAPERTARRDTLPSPEKRSLRAAMIELAHEHLHEAGWSRDALDLAGQWALRLMPEGSYPSQETMEERTAARKEIAVDISDLMDRYRHWNRARHYAVHAHSRPQSRAS